MNVLHICPRNSELIQKHVQLLVEGLKQSANVKVADNNKSLYQQVRNLDADIIHIHGLDQPVQAKAVRCAKKLNIRYVMTLHCQLEPWAIKFHRDRYLLEILLSKRDYTSNAYAVITMGKVEKENFKRLGWNPRIEVIHNALFTNIISPQEMASQTFAVYQKVLDSNTLEEMDQPTKEALAAFLKAGILGDKRWVPDTAYDARQINWRHLMLYAEHENITNYTDYGIRILGLSTPLIDTSRIAAYFPKKYSRPVPMKELIGEYQGNQTDYLVSMIRQILKAPTLLGIIELARELYRDSVNDEKIAEKLEEAGITKNAARLLQVLSEQVLLDEGFMPMPPLDDKQTDKLRNNLKNHLKI